MQVQLDEEVWQVNDTTHLGEVLAGLSDRAQAKGCLVTQLTIGNQTMTDRELVPNTLSQAAGSLGPIFAVSQPVHTLVQVSEKAGVRFGQQVQSQGRTLVQAFRQGHGHFQRLDQWFGQMADYLEWRQIHESIGSAKSPIAQELSFWVNELIRARQNRDSVRIADMLEYEVLPRLS